MVNYRRRVATFILCLFLLGLAVAQGSSDRTRLTEQRGLTLPPHAVLDEHAQPAIAAGGKVGFISSVTAGSLIAFSVKTGQMISSMVVGQMAGPVTLMESAGQRLVAVPALNEPRDGHPATVSIVDARSARQLTLRAVLVLPADAQLTQNTRAFLTRDGRYCVIASSFTEPTLFSFNVETGQVVASLALPGRPSEIAFDEDSNSFAIASAAANTVSIARLDANGRLSAAGIFSPPGMRLDEANNPAFSADGRTLYLAAGASDELYAFNAATGEVMDRATVVAPRRVTVAAGPDGELVGVTRLRQSRKGAPGGVSVIVNRGGRLTLQSDFALPERMEFSRANNVVFDASGEVAFIGSATGMLFAFNTTTAELEAFHPIGSELRRVALSEASRSVTAVRSSPGGDEIVVVDFDLAAAAEDAADPVIERLTPDVTGQGRLKDLRVKVQGRNFADGAVLVVNGADVPAVQTEPGRLLEARLDRALFNQPGDLQVRVRLTGGQLSQPATLRVVRPNAPMIERLSPAELPGPAAAFTLKVKGTNFRSSSTIFVGDAPLKTETLSETTLQAQVPADLARAVKNHKVTVRDRALPELISNEQALNIYGPRVQEAKPRQDVVVAGAGGFLLVIRGDNFRDGAQVEINGEVMPAGRVQRASDKLLRVRVPGRVTDRAGALPVVVRNPQGGESEPRSFDAQPPKITAIDPGQTLAGKGDVTVNLRGENFRRRAQVRAGGTALERRHVRFRGSKRIVVTLDGALNDLLKQPGDVEFQVINPNSGEGVPSAPNALRVVGPEVAEAQIRPVGGDPTQVRMVITGANFRQGAAVEFIKAGDVVRRRTPDSLKEGRLVFLIGARRIEALGVFEVRVVNPGEVRSNLVAPRAAAIAEGTEYE